ncbi:unnamed protein product, partial [Rotaria sp. Silwood1]
ILIDAISALVNSSGDDAPELYYHDGNAAMSICERDSSIGTYTDTQVKDKHLRDQVCSRTLKLDVRVYSFDAGAGLANRRKKQISTTSDRLELLDRSDPNDFTTAIEGFTIGLGQGDTDAASGYVLR